MKISDLVPAALPVCFESGYDSDYHPSKLDILKYIEYLKSSSNLSNKDVIVRVAKDIENLGFDRDGGSVLRYFTHFMFYFFNNSRQFVSKCSCCQPLIS